ncbi:MAG: acyl-CoA thioesterase [Archangium sp.]
MSLDVWLTPEPVSPGRYRLNFPAGWLQGRGLFGGLLMGAMVRTLETFAPERPLRSLTAEIFAPVAPGSCELVLSTLREGNAVTTVSARLEQSGEVLAHGVGVLGKQRITDRERVQLPAPISKPWHDVEAVPVQPPLGPDFARFWEFRPTDFMPFSGGAEAAAEGWIRPVEAAVKRDAGYLAACADAWWPTMFAIEEAPRPTATIAFTFQPFVNFEGFDANAPLFHRARLAAASDGYCVEFRELWSETGKLLALNQQTFVVIK